MSPLRHLLIAVLVSALFLGALKLHLFWYERKLESHDGTAVSEEKGPAPVNLFCVPVPPSPDLPPKLVALGSRLFHDPGLSADGTMSCAGCHQPDKGGTDHLPLSPALSGGFRSRNTPTVFNAGLVHAYGWDGRFKTLEEQVLAVLTSPQGLGASVESLSTYISGHSENADLLSWFFPEWTSAKAVVHALCTYLRSLNTPGCALDRYLGGEDSALSDTALAGMRVFREFGCSSCHQGVSLGDNLFSRFGVFGDYFQDRGDITSADFGRYNITGKPEDRFVFRVPGLRNISLTRPYFHDGSATDLSRAVDVMATYQLGRPLPAGDREDLLAFLHGLTGMPGGRQ